MSELIVTPAGVSSAPFSELPPSPLIVDADLFAIRRLVAEHYAANDQAIAFEGTGDKELAGKFSAEAERADEELSAIEADLMFRPVMSRLDLAKRLALLERHYPSHERELIDSDNAAERWLGIVIAGARELLSRAE